LEVIRNIIGTKAKDETVFFCEMSIISQCRALMTTRPSDMEYMLGQPPSSDLIMRLADHITSFSLAGIRAVGKRKA